MVTIMSTIKEEYLEILASGGNLTYMCDFTAEHVNNPIVITIPTRTIIAKSRDYSQDLVTEYAISAELATSEEAKQSAEYIESKLFTKKPFLHLMPYMRHKRVNCGCFHRENMVAVIDCPIVSGKSFSEESFSTIELAASVFVPALALNGYLTHTSARIMQNYLLALLKGDFNEQYQQRGVYDSTLDKIQKYMLLWIEFKERTQKPDIEKIRHMVNAFCERKEHWWTVDFDKGLVILIDASQADGIEDMKRICSGFCFISVSDVFREPKKAAEHLYLAREARHLAVIEGNDSTVVFVEQYKMPIAFLYSRQNLTLDVFENAKIKEIKEYDEANSTNYLSTLMEFLLCNMDYKSVANKMYVHRNTVYYRMNQIKKLFGIDLSDCRVITGLYLSLFAEATSK
jgi:sugar diacid utilization regulator